MKVTTLNENQYGVTIHISQPGRRYIEEFIHLTCSVDLLKLKLFPNAKEITESFAAYRAVKKSLPEGSLAREDISVVDVGCGSSPRTAATFAFRSHWTCHAVDPLVRMDKWGINPAIKRLTCHQKNIQDLSLKFDSLVVVTAVHSHAKLLPTLAAITAPEVLLVAMPCCVPLELPGIPPDREYQDQHCWSPERTVKIWRLPGDKLDQIRALKQ